MEIFETCLNLLRDDIVIFHLKDFIVQNEKLVQVGLGQGLMDFPKIIRRIQEVKPEAYLIFEGVTGEDIKTSYDYIKSLLEGK
jgi:sugar phosphate isomerase/epimerase